MSDANELAEWIRIAEEDWAAARLLLGRKQPLTNGACFHAQQCAEKYIKATLLSRNVDFPKTHDLFALNTLCERAGIFLGMKQEALEALSTWAVEARYPGESPTVEEAREAIEIAKAVRRFARKFLGLK